MKRDDRFGRPFRRHPLAAAALLACIEAASALPQGERVVAGEVGFARPGPGSLTIQQRSAKGIVSWGAFSIERGEFVRIQQPQSSSVLLNRVRGADASRIFGQLTANGQVFLLNPNGVLFAPGAQVDVGGMVASTLGLSDDDFLAGRYRFSGTGGSVVNQGRISAAERGTVALLGGSVRNDGTVEARLGTVALAAGSAMTLDLAGDGLSRIVVTRAAIDAQVANGGAIVADGGAVLLKASAVEALAGDAVGNSGVLRARTLVEREGRIVLDAGDRGTTVVTGTVDATAPSAGTRGGEVRLLGQHVGLAGTAVVDASGAAGGGRVLVGGSLQGADPAVRNAAATFVGPGATLRADALDRGAGGQVIVWSDEATRVHGTLTARGGPRGGNGGLVETSGKHLDSAGARVDASAPKGRGGTWLIDPVDVEIREGPVGGSENVTDSPDFESFFNSDAPSVVTSGDIEAALDTGTSVRVATGADAAIPQPGDITIAYGTTIQKSAGADATLSLEALRHIQSAPGSNEGSGTITISSTSGRLAIDFNARSAGGAVGAIALQDVEISTNGGSVRMYGASDAAAGRARGDNLTFQGIGLSDVSIDTVPSGGGAGGNVVLRGQGGSIPSGAGQLAGGGVAIFGGRNTASGSFAINAGSGSVTIDGVAGPGAGGAGVRIEGDATTAVLTTSGAVSITGVGSTPGAGFGSGGTGVRISLDSEGSGDGPRVATAGGNLRVRGTGGAGGPSGQGGHGVVVANATLATTSGTVSLLGTGGAGGAGQNNTDGTGEFGGRGGRGIYLSAAAVSSTSGAMTITGTGGAGGNGGTGVDGGSGGDGGQGIELAMSSLTTNQGAITMTGQAGAAGAGGAASDGSAGFGGWGADGVRINGSSVATNSGNLTLTGTGSVGGADGSGDASASLHGSGVALGHDLDSEGSPEAGEVTTGSGAIRITGFATTAAGGCDCDQAGVLVGAGSSVESTAGGTIDIRGRGVGPAAASSWLPGVWLQDASVATSGSGPGTIVVSGESTSGGPGLVFDGAAAVGGSATTGNIVLRAAGRAGVDSLELDGTIQGSGVLNIRPGGVAADGALTASDSTPIAIGQAAPATATGLAVDSAELAALEDGFSAIVFGSDTHTGLIRIVGATSFDDSVTLQNGGFGSAGISIDASLASAGNTILLSSGGPVGQAAGAPISAAALLLHGTQPQSSFQLTNSGNQVARLATHYEQVSAASTAPVVNFVNAGALTIGPAAVGGSAPSATGFDSATNQPEVISAARSTSGGDLQVRTATGDLRLTQDVATLGSDITLVAAGVLDNAGDAQLAPGGSGRWSVWADTWVGEDRGGLSASAPNPNIYGCAFGAASCASGAALPASGNHFFYVQRPTISVAADDKQRTYGAANPPLTFTFSGLLSANGDTLADAFAGQPSTAATASSSVGDYAITASPLTSPVGYRVSFTPGVLTVDPAPLTIRADDKTKVYGSAVPALTRTVTGLVLGETQGVISGGQPGTTATASTGVAEGPVPITLSPASAANYSITLVDGQLTITRAPLTVTADDKTKLAGTRNPALTASFSGFVAGDTPAIAQAAGMQLSTTAQTLSPPGEYPIRVDPFVLSNYTITTVPGTMRVLPPAQLENPTRAMASETSDLYGRNIGLPTMCFAPGVAVFERTALQTDTLSIEWSRVRQKPNLGNCVGIDQTNACSDF